MMGSLRIVEAAEWPVLASRFDDYSYRQVREYAEAMARRTGARAEHVCVARNGQPLGLASVRIKRMPGTGTGLAYVSGGPLVRANGDGHEPSRLEAVLAALVDEYVHQRHLTLRVAPAIADPDWNTEQERTLADLGFEPVGHLRANNTILVDTSRPIDEIKAGLVSTWRNRLRKSLKAEIDIVEGTDPALTETFLPLYAELRTRKEFEVDLEADFYAELQRLMPERERLQIAIASIDGEPAAGIVLSYLGDTAVYLLGAANELGRKSCAPYLLHWNAVELAAQRGLRWYDLGGIDPDGNPGGYFFKRRMGGFEVSMPAFAVAPGLVRGRAVRAAEGVVRAIRARRR